MDVCFYGSEQQQPKTIAPLVYQIGLLRQRNKILNLENENLVTKIEQLQKIISELSFKQKQYAKQYSHFNSNKQKEKQALNKLIELLQAKLTQESSCKQKQLQIIHEMMNNSCPIYSIIDQLYSILYKETKMLQNGKKSADNLCRLQKLVQKRKERIWNRLGTNRQIVHLIKQPTFKQSNLGECDLVYIVRSTEKIIRKTKRTEVSNQRISQVIDQMNQLIRLKQVIREQQKNLRIAERQRELGCKSSTSIQIIGSELIGLENQELQMKKNIQDMIFNL